MYKERGIYNLRICTGKEGYIISEYVQGKRVYNLRICTRKEGYIISEFVQGKRDI